MPFGYPSAAGRPAGQLSERAVHYELVAELSDVFTFPSVDGFLEFRHFGQRCGSVGPAVQSEVSLA